MGIRKIFTSMIVAMAAILAAPNVNAADIFVQPSPSEPATGSEWTFSVAPYFWLRDWKAT
jgi:hypothetical protein